MTGEAKLRALLAGVADDIIALVPELVRERLASLLDGPTVCPPTAQAPAVASAVASAVATPSPTTVREPHRGSVGRVADRGRETAEGVCVA